jgi:flagellar hook-associated protein 3
MNLRISLQSLVNTSIGYEQQQTSAIAKLQEQASSGNRILTPDDDPLGAVAVINYTSQITNYDTDLANINTATANLNVSVSTLQDANNIITQARQLAIEATNSGNDSNSLGALADQADALLKQFITDANAQNNGQYVFGGTRSNTVPFVTDAAGNVTYVGGAQRAGVPVGPAQTVDTFYAGSEVFRPPQGAATVYTGTTGAQPGTGVDTATGQGTLVVTHTATTYGGGSGVAASATGSAAGDTVIGPAGANTLTVVDTSGNGTSGTVSLNGGPAVAFTNSDQNLKVTGPNGEVVYLDTTNVTAGFNGSVPITADGTLSVPGGQAVPIDFSSNQVVTGTDGTVTNVNSTNIRQAGKDTVTYGGTLDAFQVLAGLRDDLRNSRNLGSPAQLQSISNRLGELTQVSHNILRIAGEQSATLQNLNGLQAHVQDVQLQTKQLSGDVQSADIASVVTQLQAQQNLLQATLEVTAQMFSQSLLNFIK